MNSFSKISKLFLVLWIGLFSILDVKTLSETVLCIGRDGHVALETSNDGDCCLPGSSNVGNYRAHETTDHCGQCTDMQISVAHQERVKPCKNFESQNFQFLTLAFFHVLFINPPSVQIAPLCRSTTPLGETALVSHRSIVFVI